MGRPPLVQRDELLAAARKVFSDRGYDGATLAEIGQRVGVSAAAVLRHAPTKDALFRAAFSADAGGTIPPAFLAEVPGEADPRATLRRLAELMIPFLESKLAEHVAIWQRSAAAGEMRPFLPFDPAAPDSPPKRGLGLLADYLARATAAGRLRITDPHAAALSFAGGLHAYVFFHRISGVFAGRLTKERYIDALLDIWLDGAAAPAGRKPRKTAVKAARPSSTRPSRPSSPSSPSSPSRRTRR
jgi:AcrR family transcriptional regulator